jgi:hypothetical protein
MKSEKVKICMNAMVGSEEATITRMLNSVAPHIDYYVVQCNGKDNTRQIIDDFFKEKGIPGFTYEIEWKYPGFNRNHTLQEALKANHNCDWILRMDADEQLQVDDNFDWSILENTSIASWNITADCGDSFYFRTWLWNAKLPWFFADDKRHETIHLPEVGENFNRMPLPIGFKQIITNDGETWLKPMKFLTDALELELDKVPSNKVLEDDYHLWYIGKSYSDSYGDATQFPFGMHHAKEYARRCIFYFTMFLDRQHAWLKTNAPRRDDDMAYYALILIGDALSFLGENEKAVNSYKDAHRFNRVRNENFIRLALQYHKMEQYKNMLDICDNYLNKNRKNPFPLFSFFIDKSAYSDTSDYPNSLRELAIKSINDQLNGR